MGLEDKCPNFLLPQVNFTLIPGELSRIKALSHMLIHSPFTAFLPFLVALLCTPAGASRRHLPDELHSLRVCFWGNQTRAKHITENYKTWSGKISKTRHFCCWHMKLGQRAHLQLPWKKKAFLLHSFLSPLLFSYFISTHSLWHIPQHYICSLPELFIGLCSFKPPFLYKGCFLCWNDISPFAQPRKLLFSLQNLVLTSLPEPSLSTPIISVLFHLVS